jgi:hypothetical protein
VRRPTNIVYDRETILNIRTLGASNITGIRWHLDILRKHRILTDTVTPCPQLPGGGSSRDGVDVNKLNSFFQLLPSKKRYRSLRCSTTRLRNSFLPQAVRMLNAPASQIFSLDFIYYLFIHHWDVCLFEMYVWSWSVRNAFSFCCSINKMTINLIWFWLILLCCLCSLWWLERPSTNSYVTLKTSVWDAEVKLYHKNGSKCHL